MAGRSPNTASIERQAMRAAGLLGAIMLVSVSFAAHAQAVDTELRIVELSLRDRQTLAREMLAHETTDGTLYLPLAETMAAIGFPIAVDAAGGAEGWFLRETQRFRLDRANGTVEVAGRRYAIESGDVRDIDGGPHVSTGALDRWFSLGVRWSSDQQLVSLAPVYLLADEERARRGGVRGGDSGSADYSGFVRAGDGPGWLSWPYLTANLGLAVQDGGGETLGVQASVFAQGDLLGMSAQAALSASAPGRFDGRLTLGRYDAGAGLLGPLGATVVEVGDINLQATPLLLRNGAGLGARIGRGPMNASGRFDQTDLVGDAPPGWQAELYRDNQLLSFQTVGSDGRYLFAATPLLFGANRFRIVLYGPSGERQTVLRNLDIAQGLIAPGTLVYAVAAMRQGRSLFRRSLFGDISRSPGDPALDDSLLFNPTGLHVQASAGYGVSRAFSLTGIVVRREEDRGIRATYAGGGIGWRLGPALLSGDVLVQQGGATARRLAAIGALGGISLSIEREEYDSGYVSDENRIAVGVTTRSRDSASIDGILGAANWNLSGSRTRRSDGGSDGFASARASLLAGPLSITPRVSYRDLTLSDRTRDQRLDAGIAAAGSTGPWRLRALLDIDFTPVARMRRIGGEAGLRLADWFLAAAVDRDLLQPSTRWRLAGNCDWNGIRVGLEGRYEDVTRRVAGLLTVAFAVDRAPRGGGVRLGRDARSSGGTIVARVFEDRDLDGRFGTGDALVEGAGVLSDPRGQAERSGDGLVIENLPIDRPIAVMPDLADVENPYLAATIPGRLVTARAGGVVRVDLPVVEAGSIEVMLTDAAGAPATGTIIALHRCAGGTAEHRVRAAFDGAALAELVAPGCWLLKVAEKDVGRITVTPGALATIAVRLEPAP